VHVATPLQLELVVPSSLPTQVIDANYLLAWSSQSIGVDFVRRPQVISKSQIMTDENSRMKLRVWKALLPDHTVPPATRKDWPFLLINCNSPFTRCPLICLRTNLPAFFVGTSVLGFVLNGRFRAACRKPRAAQALVDWYQVLPRFGSCLRCTKRLDCSSLLSSNPYILSLPTSTDCFCLLVLVTTSHFGRTRAA
jgi:hypothetical protein